MSQLSWSVKETELFETLGVMCSVVILCIRVIGDGRDLWGSSPTPAKQVPCVRVYTLSLLAVEVKDPTAVLYAYSCTCACVLPCVSSWDAAFCSVCSWVDGHVWPEGGSLPAVQS